MKSEVRSLKQNPLLINKIIAERLSDKLQIMMVPSDGKFFFANDVLRNMNVGNQASRGRGRNSTDNELASAGGLQRHERAAA